MKTFFLCLFFINRAWADNVRIKSPAILGEIITDGVKIMHSQATLACQFEPRGNAGFKNRIRYAHTYHAPIAENRYSIRIKKFSLTEFLPTFELLNCSYRLILIAEDHNQKTMLGEFIFLGKNKGKMSAEEIKEMGHKMKDIQALYQPLEVFINYKNGTRFLDYR